MMMMMSTFMVHNSINLNAQVVNKDREEKRCTVLKVLFHPHLYYRVCACITLLCCSVLTIKNMKKKKKQAVLFCSIFYFALCQRYSLLLF